MLRRQGLENIGSQLQGGALTIGNFDGVHRGHAQILQRVRHWADTLEGPALVLTFDPHPVRILRPESAPVPLTWNDRKADLIQESGIDALIAIPTNRQLLELSPSDFFEQIVRKALGAKAIVEGPNFHFGVRRTGNVDLLAEYCDRLAIQLEVVPPLQEGGQLISSSRVREALRHGHVTLARSMLTHPYRLRGLVVHGDRRGTTLGFPTANLEGIDTLVPAAGVYGGQAFPHGKPHRAAIHIGPLPTFGSARSRVEVHILDFTGNLYGEPLEIEFLAKLRDICQFATREELQTQLHLDIAAARHLDTY